MSVLPLLLIRPKDMLIQEYLQPRDSIQWNSNSFSCKMDEIYNPPFERYSVLMKMTDPQEVLNHFPGNKKGE